MDRAAIQEQIGCIAADLGTAYGGFTFSPGGSAADVVLSGPCSRLRPDDPRLAGSADRLFALVIAAAELPDTLRPAHELVDEAGRAHRVVRIDRRSAGMLVEIVLTP